ncbi:hypothetical protein CBR_g37194 [Chara braunii]|uniref:Uncharacterized protein n=1 Tax=Chara braunii TaxID=69332 RepID=A0A388LMQ8_CHABU|nr:hypothetical protein CBR_g37194 [Chara braunii]|eukprot:GBG83482.1 hypothetical protein CBR_g37194 [Chara braunii]
MCEPVNGSRSTRRLTKQRREEKRPTVIIMKPAVTIAALLAIGLVLLAVYPPTVSGGWLACVLRCDADDHEGHLKVDVRRPTERKDVDSAYYRAVGTGHVGGSRMTSTKVHQKVRADDVEAPSVERDAEAYNERAVHTRYLWSRGNGRTAAADADPFGSAIRARPCGRVRGCYIGHRESRVLQVVLDGLAKVEVVAMVTLWRQRGTSVLLTILERAEAAREGAALLRGTAGATAERGTALGSVVRRGGGVARALRPGGGGGVKMGSHLSMVPGGLVSLWGRWELVPP